jgi:hypothetical protein
VCVHASYGEPIPAGGVLSRAAAMWLIPTSLERIDAQNLKPMMWSSG